MDERLDFGLNFGIDISKLEKLSKEILELKKVLNDIMNTSNKSINNNLISEIEKVEQRYNKFLSEFSKTGNTNVSLLNPTIQDLKKLQKEMNQTFKNSPAVKEYQQLSSMIEQNTNKLKQFKDVQLSLKDSKGSFMSMGNAIKEVDGLKEKLKQLKDAQNNLYKNSSDKSTYKVDTKEYQELLKIKQRIKDIESATPKDYNFKETFKNFKNLRVEVENYEKVINRLGKKASSIVNTDKDVQQYRNLQNALKDVQREQDKIGNTSNVTRGLNNNSSSVNRLTKDYITLLNTMSNTKNNLKSVNDTFKGTNVNGLNIQTDSYKNITIYSQKLIDLELKRQKIVESISKSNRENLNYISRMANMNPREFAQSMAQGSNSQRNLLKNITDNINSNPFISNKNTSQLKSLKIMGSMTSESDIKSMVDSISRNRQQKMVNDRVLNDINRIKKQMESVSYTTSTKNVDRLGNIIDNRVNTYDSKNRPEISNAYRKLWADLDIVTKKVNNNIEKIETKHKDLTKFANEYKNIMNNVKSNPNDLINNRYQLRNLLDNSPNISSSQKWLAERNANRLDNQIQSRITVQPNGNELNSDFTSKLFKTMTSAYIGYMAFQRVVKPQDLYDFEKQTYAFSVASEQGDTKLQSGIKSSLLRETTGKPLDTNKFISDVTEVVKTGRSFNEAMILVSGSTDLAVANFQSLTTATEILNNQLLALDLDVTADRVQRMSSRMHSALVNTALDFNDISNAGRQSNTVLSSLSEMADQFGVGSKNRSFKGLDDYKEQLDYLNFAMMGDLRQKGKTGGQAGTVIRNMMTKLVQLDNTGTKRLDSDLARVDPALLKEIGFSSSKEMMQLMRSDVFSVLEGLSKLQDKGALSFATISKMFTERHASSISALLSDIDGNLDKFITTITTGKDVTKDATFAVKNWASQFDILMNNYGNFKKILINGGILPSVGMGGLQIVNGGLQTMNNISTSTNPLVSTAGQSISQALITTTGYNMLNSVIKQQAVNKISDAFLMAENSPNANVNELRSMRDSAMMKVSSGKLVDNLKYASANAKTLAGNLNGGATSLDSAIGSSKKLGGSLKEMSSSAFGLSKIFLGIMAINLAINGYLKLKEIMVKNDSIDKGLQNDKETAKDFGKVLVNLEKQINQVYTPPKNIGEGYSNLIDDYVSKNVELLESLRVVKMTADKTFKTLSEVSNEYVKNKYTDVEILSKPNPVKDVYNKYDLDLSNTITNRKGFSSQTVYLEHLLDDKGKKLLYEKEAEILKNSKTNSGNVAQQSLRNINRNLGKDLQTSGGENIKELQDIINKEFIAGAKKTAKEIKTKKLDEVESLKYTSANLFSNISSETLNKVFQYDGKSANINDKDSSFERMRKLVSTYSTVDEKTGEKSYDFQALYSQIEKLGLNTNERKMFFDAIKESTQDFIAIDEEYLKQMTVLKETRDNLLQNLNSLRATNKRTILSKLGMTYTFDFEKDNFKSTDFNNNSTTKQANDLLKKELNTSPFLNKDIDKAIEYQAQLKSNILQQYQLQEKLNKEKENYNKKKSEMTTQDRIGVENEIKQLEESLQYVTSARGEIQKAYQLSIYNNASMEQLYDLRKQMTSNMTKYLYQGSTSFGNKGGDLLSGFYEFQQNRNYFNKYGRDSLNAQVLEANRNLTTNQRKFLGVNSFNNITPEQAMELQQNLLNAKSNNQTSLIQNGQQISVSEAEELALKMSSISAEQMSVRTKELELLQQRKSIEIEIVKMELEANKLSTQYVKSVALANNEFEQQMFSNSRYLVGNATTQLEDKNRLLQMKIEGQTLKLNDQIAQTKQAIKVSIENAIKQINAIKELDNQVENSADKIINELPNRLSPFFQQLSQNISSIASLGNESFGNIGTTGVINGSKNIMDIIALGETDKKASDPRALGRSDTDTGNSLSYGVLGMNTRGPSSSMESFVKYYGASLGLPTNIDFYRGPAGQKKFKEVANANPQAMYKAQESYLYNQYFKEKTGTNYQGFVQKYLNQSLWNNEGVKASIIDTVIQQGRAGSISSILKGNFKQYTDPKSFLDAQKSYELSNYKTTFKSALAGGYYSLNAHKNRLNKRYSNAYALMGNNDTSMPMIANNVIPTQPEKIPLSKKDIDVVKKIKELTQSQANSGLAKDVKTLRVMDKYLDMYTSFTSKGNTKIDALNKVRSQLEKDALSFKDNDINMSSIVDVFEQVYSTVTDQLQGVQEQLVERKKAFLEAVNSFSYVLNENTATLQSLERKKANMYSILSDNEFSSWYDSYQDKLELLNAQRKDFEETTKFKVANNSELRELYLDVLGYGETKGYAPLNDMSYNRVDFAYPLKREEIPSLFQKSVIKTGYQEENTLIPSRPLVLKIGNVDYQQKKLDDINTVQKYMLESDPKIIQEYLVKMTQKFMSLAGYVDSTQIDELSKIGSLNSTDQTKALNKYYDENLKNRETEKGKILENTKDQTIDDLKSIVEAINQYKEQFNKVVELEKQKIELNREYIENTRKSIIYLSEMFYNINKKDNSSKRDFSENLMQYKLVGSGVSLDSPYGKSIMSGVKFKNALDLIQENIQNFNIRLQTLSVSSLFSQAGLNSSDLLLRGNDTVGMARAFGVLNSLKENNQLSSQTSFNKLYGELKKEDMYGILGNSNITTNQGILDLINKIEEAKKDKDIDKSYFDKVNELQKIGSELLNGNPVINDTIKELIDMLKQNTSALQESMTTYNEVYKMGVGILSDFLFSKDFKAVDPSTAFNNLFSNPIFSGFTNTLAQKVNIFSNTKDMTKEEAQEYKSKYRGIKTNAFGELVNKNNEVLDPVTLEPKTTTNSKGEIQNLKGQKVSGSQILNVALNSMAVIDGLMKQQMEYKIEELKVQEQILQLNLQMAETSEERRAIEEQILQNKLSQVDSTYNQQSSFMGIASGTTGFGLQGALGGAMQGSAFGPAGAIVGGTLGLFSGLKAGLNAKAQASQEKAMLISQQKMQWLAEDSNRYLKTMSESMSEQAKWTTKIGVNDAISRSVAFAMSGGIETIGGTASENRKVQKKSKKLGGLVKKKWDEVETFTASYNLNDPMFGGRKFETKQDLEFALATVGQNLINNPLLSMQTSLNSSKVRAKFGNQGSSSNSSSQISEEVSRANEYLNYIQQVSTKDLTASQFLRAWNQQDTLKNMGVLIDKSGQSNVDKLIADLEANLGSANIQDRVNIKAKIDFYNNIKAVLDKEGKTTKRLFGQYYGIDTEEIKDEKGNTTEYKRINESMWSDYYSQVVKNSLEGGNTFTTGSTFVQGTLSAFVQNVSSSKNSIKALTDQFSKLADEIYDVVTRTGEFTNVNGNISNMIDNLRQLTEQQKEVDKFTVDLAKQWTNLGGNITDVVADMSNGLSIALNSIRESLLGSSMEDNLNNFGTSLFSKLSESLTTNLINKKYSTQIFDVNASLSQAIDTNSVYDIVSLGSMYKGIIAKAEADRQRIEALSRLFTANRNIDYMDEGITYETGTSQAVNYNITNTNEFNIGTLIADEMTVETFVEEIGNKIYNSWLEKGLKL